ncbi:hypothetical protein ACWN83_08490 [Pseudolactococcus plantarum]|uniref:Lipoprotein n=1 Tax=Pseudolactococcus plantarum TaxID=1365 RepID=A0A2A5RWY8_9LACT|nr:hypothetical protein [Lactococcus plantarum]PCS05739.1 hypothetical protein RU87_GL000449 [Lactococcus plantarum]HCN74402.1 hypothetical protein [Lactococcus sp.]
MKNKLLTAVVIGGVGIIALSGCAKDNKTEFFKYSQELSKASYQKFDMNLNHVEVKGDSKYQLYAPMINGYLSGVKLSGDSSTDGKNKAVNTTITLLGQEFPLAFLIKGETPYLKLDNMGPILNFYLNMASQSTGMPAQTVDTTSLKNKYVDVLAIAEENNKKATEVKSVTSEDSQKAVEKTLKSMDKANFKKDGSAITLTLSGKELAKLVETYMDELPKSSQDSLKSATKDKDLEAEIAKVIKSTTITLDNKKKTANTKMNFTGDKTNGIGLSGYVTYDVSYDNKKVTVSLPKDENIIKSSNELSNLFSKLMPTGIAQ